MTPPTLVAVHAHPDDESIFTGGLLVRAAAAGWRTVVVLLTSGEAGVTPGFDVTDTGTHRRAEAIEACRRLGVDRLVVLPFCDSGRALAGRPVPGTLSASNFVDVVESFEVALAAERPTAYTTYDSRGVYGHADHVVVHCLGRQLAATGAAVYEATIDRHHLHSLRDELVGRRALAPWKWPSEVTNRIGSTEDDGPLLHVALDPVAELSVKEAALAAHGSQIAFASDFMGLPPGAFHRLLAHEWFLPAGRVEPRFEALAENALAGVTTS